MEKNKRPDHLQLFYTILFNLFLIALIFVSFFFSIVKCGDIDKLFFFLFSSWILFFLTMYCLIKFSTPRFFKAIKDKRMILAEGRATEDKGVYLAVESKRMILALLFARSLVFWGVISFIMSMILSLLIVGTMCGCERMLFPAGTYAFGMSTFSIGYSFMKAYKQIER
jgi:hypothetical protein